MIPIKPEDTPIYPHDSPALTGVLIVNLGTPDAPNAAALRRYLGEFLSDPRVVDLPRWLWRIMLHGVILRTRPARSAKAYQKVWTENGSPLLHISEQQQQALQQRLSTLSKDPIVVKLGMRYGNPSIKSALETLRAAHVQRLIVLPLYPQYSATTVASTFDAIAKVFKQWRWLPALRFNTDYHDHPAYIKSLADSVRRYWQQQGEPEKILFSFHGIPKRMFLAGDPYYCHCHKTARLLAEALALPEPQWELVFQSRFGREEWLKPYADLRLQALGAAKTKRVDVLCPGFPADCLETLEEIAQSFRDIYVQAGGEEFHYIPALNTDESHIDMMANLLLEQAGDWIIPKYND